MTIKNADMPAMPQPMVKGYNGDIYTTFDNYCGKQAGLTKREMFAMHQSTVGFECDVNFLGDFIGRVVDIQNPIDLLMASIEAEAKVKVIKADVLLKELEK